MDAQKVKSDLVLILDFGSQYTHLITRRIRSLSVFSLCISGTSPLKSIIDINPRVIILSGGPHSVHAPDAPVFCDGFVEYVEANGVHVLGICYGLQLIVQKLGGLVKVGDRQEYGKMNIEVISENSTFFGSRIKGDKQDVWMSHGDEVSKLPDGFKVVAVSQQGAVAAIENPSRKFYGLQYHPEVTHSTQGMKTLRYFLFDVCGVSADWNMEDVLNEEIKVIKETVGADDHVICALSGGVDSTVAATLVHKAIGDRLHCIFVDNGLLRYKERERVMDTFEEHLHLPVTCVDASEQFLSKLKGVADPETKRKIIGKEFICIFDEFAQELEKRNVLFVGDLHWWTTDAELETELVKYGNVKEVKFFDEKASGKSKGYCQVEFYDAAAALACKEGMNGHVFNGRPCVVAFASPFTVKRMGEAQVNRNQQTTPQTLSQPRRGPAEGGNKPTGNNISTGGNYQGGDQNRNFMRGSWGRGNPQGMGGRGPVGPIRNRPAGGMAGRGIMGNGGNGFGQGMGPSPPMMHPQAMMGQGFDPGFGGPMGRMGNYGGFPGGPQPPFQGLMSNFPPVGNVGLPGVAPHVNPAFFGRGMPMNGMGMMPNAGVDGPNMGMWSDPNMGAWAGDEHAGRAAESSYGEEAVSDHQYGEASHDRTGWQNPVKEKVPDRDFSGSSDRKYREDREPGYDRDIPREKEAAHDHEWPDRRHRDDRETRDRERDRDRERSRDRDRERSRDRDRERERDRDRYREDRDRYADHHRYRDREADYDEEWERRPSRTHSKSRVSQEEERPRSRDADYGKRRRITSE